MKIVIAEIGPEAQATNKRTKIERAANHNSQLWTSTQNEECILIDNTRQATWVHKTAFIPGQ